MPELPEVETVVRSLRPKLVGARLGKVTWSGLGLRMGHPPDVKGLQALAKQGHVSAVRRLAKYILVDVVGPKARAQGTLLVHLGMTGRLQVVAADVTRRPHTHIVIALDGKRELRFVDPRRFGWVAPVAAGESAAALAGLGPDPLRELTVETLRSAMKGSRAPLKAFLLDQRKIAGLGNIYVCEALFRARIHPTRPANQAGKGAAALFAAIQHVLTLGIENRGTTLRDYVDGDGNEGGNSTALLVYGRAGKPCSVCGAAIKRRVDAGRSTFFCPGCQRR